MMGDYDDIVIGAGISGLICSAYLSRSGRRVLLLEQSSQAGGYCGSFSRKGFDFDIGIHYFGGMGENGVLRKIFKDVEILDSVSQVDPADSILLPDGVITFRSNLDLTIESFSSVFPISKDRIVKFFNEISSENIMPILLKSRFWTFRDFLDQYFSDERLKVALSVPLGNLGLPSSVIMAPAAITLYREFLINSGYQSKRSHRFLVDEILNFSKKFGLILKLGSKAEKIFLNKHGADVLVKGDVFRASNIVACCDQRRILESIESENRLEKKDINVVKKMIPSPSLFIVYLGFEVQHLTDDVKNFLKFNGVWYTKKYNIDNHYKNVFKGNLDFSYEGFFASVKRDSKSEMPSEKERFTVTIINTAPFRDEAFWLINKQMLEDHMLDVFLKKFCFLKPFLKAVNSASPITLEKYTLNSSGAAYGWASISENFKIIANKLGVGSLKNLYFAGHWSPQFVGQGGVSMAAYSGMRVANGIIKKAFRK